jgi:hypothetical protein
MRRLVAVAVLSGLSLAACQSSVDRTGTTTRGFYAPSFDTVWETTQSVMRRDGFTPDPEQSGKVGRTIVSRWNVQLHPFSHQGTREQATVYLKEVEGNPNHWTIEANVVRQTNNNLKDPSNPIRAQWGPEERVPETEARLSHDVEVFFLGYDVSPEFRATYGMPAARREIPAPEPTGPTVPPSTTR